MRSWWGEVVGSHIESPEVAVDIRPAYLPAAAAGYAGVACAVPWPGNRLVDNVPLCGVLLRCRGPCHVPFSENGGCWVAEMLPVAGTVTIAGDWAVVPATSVLGPLGLDAISTQGPLGVHSCSCSGVAPCSNLLASVRVAVAASASC